MIWKYFSSYIHHICIYESDGVVNLIEIALYASDGVMASVCDGSYIGICDGSYMHQMVWLIETLLLLRYLLFKQIR